MPVDTTVEDFGAPDAGVPDAGVPDAGVPDVGVPDVGVPDVGVEDVGVEDVTELTGCTIDGTPVELGTSDPSNPCRVCAADAADAWSAAPDGTACDGGICRSGACVAQCNIGGANYDDGATDPANGCQRCVIATSQSAWTPSPDGESCGDGKICHLALCEAGCVVDGAFLAAGDTTTSACQVCEPTQSTTTTVAAPDGIGCGDGQVCSGGACAAGCYVDGAFYAGDALDPQNTCGRCDPAQSVTAWSPLDDGAACATGMVCDAGACSAKCFVGGALVNAGAVDPGDPCGVCAPAQSTEAWSTQSDGTSCGAGSFCYSGTCSAGCWIAGALQTTGTVNPVNPCQVCDPPSNASGWSTAAQGTACGAGQVCNGAVCQTACVISGVIVAANAKDPDNACAVCTPATSTTDWTPRANGSSCGATGICSNAKCSEGCFINSAAYSAGDLNPANPCQLCQPGVSTSAWSNRSSGTLCGDGLICTGGSCASGCFVGGSFYASGTLRPQNACERCLPTTSTSEWSAVSDGAACGGGKVCWNAGCSSGCVIDGAYYASGAEAPGQPCLRCTPGASTSSWTGRLDGTVCEAGAVCVAGACQGGCYINSTFIAPGTADGPCLACTPSASTATWTPVPNGDPCGVGQVCNTGLCEAACFVGGLVVAPKAVSSTNSCLVCTPASQTDDWSPRQDGTVCATGKVCSASACLAGCYVDGAYRTADEAVGSACQTCKPTVNPLATTAAPNGTPCASGQVCQSGACALGCFIDGVLRASDAPRSGYPCQSCQPDVATTAWSNLTDGGTCAGGKICSAGACNAECFIDGAVVASGAVDPLDPCGVCKPSTSTSTWSDQANGTLCGAGAYCTSGACTPGCWISGVFRAPGAVNPSNACQVCNPDATATGWSTAELGTACAAGKVCSGAACTSACVIAGAIVNANTQNPDNACEVCTPATLTTGWSLRANGSSCGATGICTAGNCSEGCFIGSVAYDAGASNPANACQVCQPATTKTAWTYRSTGSVCGVGAVCSTNICKPGCSVAGTFAAPGAARPGYPCQQCDTAQSTTAWTNAIEGTTCSFGKVCSAGVCQSGCFIGDAVFAANAVDPTSPCRVCTPNSSTTSWTLKANGLSCGSGEVCSSGECVSGCYISGKNYAAGALSGTCKVCNPATSTTAWSSVPNGTSCALGKVCGSGTCTSACFISGALVTTGAAEPGNPCRTCDPVQLTTDWSGLPDGTGCGTGKVCSAATCKSGCFISNTFWASGASVTGACKICDPSKTVLAASSAANGTACGDGQVCATGVCSTLCYISGTLRSPGDTPIGNVCQSCQPDVSTTTYSPKPQGTGCAFGKVCDAGACLAKCFVDGSIQPSGGVDPTNKCAICTPTSQTTAWSNRSDGTDCGSGVFCSSGTCAARCLISGVLRSPGDRNPSNSCQMCDPDSADTSWSTAPLGSSCSTYNVCNGTVCMLGCSVDGAVFANATTNPLNACEACKATTSTTSFTPVANGASCTSGGVCTSGQCSDGCSIGGQSYAAGEVDPTNPCRLCQPGNSKTLWTTKPSGSVCGPTEVCSAGLCKTGCYISSQFNENGALRTGYSCQRCDTSLSLTTWSYLETGSVCSSTKVCSAGACITGCYIDGAIVNASAADPTSPCRVCDITRSLTSYSNKANATSCGSSVICNEGLCGSGCIVNNVYYVAGASDPNNECLSCQPALSTSAFKPSTSGAQCAGGTCLDGGCVTSIALTAVQPSCTGNSGGAQITLTGGPFAPGSTVTVAGVAATSVEVVNSTKLTALTPATPGVFGQVPVTVSNAFGPSASATALFGLYSPFVFKPAVTTFTGSIVPARTAVGDVDGDGRSDLVYALENDVIIKRQGANNGSFAATSTYTGCIGPGPIAVVDVTGDGLADVLLSCEDTLQVLRGVASGVPVYFSTMNMGFTIRELVVGNLGGTNAVDLAILSYVTTTNVARTYFGSGTGTFTAGPTIDFVEAAGYLTTGDVTGDGKEDILAGNYATGHLQVAINSGTGTFAMPTVMATVPGLQSVDLAHLNGDARADVIVGSVASSVSASYFLSLGGGTLGPRVNLTGGGLASAKAGDFNGDGNADVLVPGGTGVRVFPGNGDGTFSCVFEELGSSLFYVHPGDFDGNGHLDFVATNPSLPRLVTYMNGD